MTAIKLVLLVGCLLLQACATTTKTKIYQNMAIAGTAGVLIGQTRPDYPNTNSVILGSMSAAAAAVVTLYFNDPDKELKKAKDELALLKKAYSPDSTQVQVAQKPIVYGEEIAEKYRAMVNPGEWRVYEVDRWREEGENRLVHEDKVIELIPPSLSGGR